ncbi:glycosyltransferase [Pelagibacterales bacterium SAG-MED15]|nr:glycosyltransferase [Pelagibacterales bacterium SAG-MED15]
MIRLAFVIHSTRTWLGGVNVILNLINSILSSPKFSSRIKVILFTDSKLNLNKFKLNKNVEIIESSELFKINLLCRIIDKISIIFYSKTIYLEKILRKYNVDFITHTSFATGKKSIAKSIVWIPDLQYIYFPELFSFKYRLLKKINIYICKDHAFKILLSSKSALSDIKRICNIKNKKLIVSKFTFNLPKPKNLKKFSYLKKKYSLNKNFFYLPNQYWVHKNHKVVIEAINAIKKNSNKNIIVYSSGSKKDYRSKNNFQNIFKLVKSYKLDKNYIYLGLIPYNDVMSLIYYSLAVINPSNFEGWSSTVEQAKGYNKKIILSDIKVHREQNPKNAFFFAPKNYLKLSKILIKLSSTKSKNFQAKYDKDLKKQVNKYTEKFCSVILSRDSRLI